MIFYKIAKYIKVFIYVIFHKNTELYGWILFPHGATENTEFFYT